MAVAFNVGEVLRNLGKAAKFIEGGELKRAALYMEISLAAVQSCLEQRGVVVRFVPDVTHQDVPL